MQILKGTFLCGRVGLGVWAVHKNIRWKLSIVLGPLDTPVHNWSKVAFLRSSSRPRGGPSFFQGGGHFPPLTKLTTGWRGKFSPYVQNSGPRGAIFPPRGQFSTPSVKTHDREGEIFPLPNSEPRKRQKIDFLTHFRGGQFILPVSILLKFWPLRFRINCLYDGIVISWIFKYEWCTNETKDYLYSIVLNKSTWDYLENHSSFISNVIN